MLEPRSPDFDQRVRESFARQGMMQHIGASLVRVEAGLVEIHVPYHPSLTQQHGFFHAGTIATAADSAGGYAALSLMPADASVLSVEFKINLMSPADGDLLIARAKVMKAGRTLTVCQVEVFIVKNEIEKLCALMQMTLMTMMGMADDRGRFG